jgi:hypothetical protein
VQKLDAESSIFSFLASGDPANRYRLEFDGPGISRDSNGKIRVVDHHEVIVELGASYPRMVPNLLWQTPIFHPNISNNGVVCLGGYGTHWVPSLTLDEMSTMLWDMIRYKNFDIQSPYNREAALWARDQKAFTFPLDDRNIRDLVNNPQSSSQPFGTSSRLETPRPASRKSVSKVLGSLANRFRNRSNRESVATEIQGDNRIAHLNDDVQVVEAVEAVVVEEVAESSENDLVDPTEVEVIEDGISFLDDVRNNTAVETNVVEDTGIVFLD